MRFPRRLGLDVPADADTQPHVEVELPGGFRIAWDTEETIRSFDPEWTRPPGSGIGLAFACDSPAEVDRTYDELTAAGYDGHRKPWDAFWGQRYAVVLDPNGYGIDLYAPLP